MAARSIRVCLCVSAACVCVGQVSLHRKRLPESLSVLDDLEPPCLCLPARVPPSLLHLLPARTTHAALHAHTARARRRRHSCAGRAVCPDGRQASFPRAAHAAAPGLQRPPQRQQPAAAAGVGAARAGAPACSLACLSLVPGLSCLSCCLHCLGSLYSDMTPAAVVGAESMHTDRPAHGSVLTVCCWVLCVCICWWLCDVSAVPVHAA